VIDVIYQVMGLAMVGNSSAEASPSATGSATVSNSGSTATTTTTGSVGSGGGTGGSTGSTGGSTGGAGASSGASGATAGGGSAVLGVTAYDAAALPLTLAQTGGRLEAAGSRTGGHPELPFVLGLLLGGLGVTAARRRVSTAAA
jgi:hypothetical protein